MGGRDRVSGGGEVEVNVLNEENGKRLDSRSQLVILKFISLRMDIFRKASLAEWFERGGIVWIFWQGE